MIKYDFIAIDFETTFPPHVKPNYICQVGIVAVKNGEIVDKYCSLVQPPNNHYDKATSNFHGITPEMTNDKPTWEELWPKIEHYFIGQTLVAHNAKFETDVLRSTSDYYGIMLMGINPIFCTCDAFQRHGLEALCLGFGMSYDPNKHHDALYDAECCAQFFLNYLSGINPDMKITEKTSKAKREKRKNNERQFSRSESLSGDILKKDLSKGNPNNPFYDRKIVITGEFKTDRRQIALQLKAMGADIDTAITKKTNYVFIGDEPGPSKIEKVNKLIHDGFNIRKIYQSDFEEILLGNWEPYYCEKQIIKELDFTLGHFESHRIKFDNQRNILASKEIYYGKGFIGNMDIFKIITGNLGAFGDDDIYPETNICLLSDSTIEKLRTGIKDDTILYIQNHYNKSKALTFELQFLCEGDVLEFCKERCEKCGDTLTMGYYEKYLRTAKENL